MQETVVCTETIMKKNQKLKSTTGIFATAVPTYQ